MDRSLVGAARPAGDTAAIVAVPATGPQDEPTVDLIRHLRDDVVPAAVAGSDATVHVGGAVAAFVDESEVMGDRLPLFVGAVIALSFLLLLAVFRSLLVAVKAAVMNVLAIGAAYGVMALALSGGWLGQAFGITESTPVPVWLPMMMFALRFGLSMDYGVFLRLAAAVLLDASVVRMVLVPSTMELLGDRNWWLPRWLDRLLPRLDVEGGSSPAPVGGDRDAGVDAVDDLLPQPVLEEV